MTIARSTIIAAVAAAALVAQPGLALSKNLVVISGPITKNKSTSSTPSTTPHPPAVTQVTKPKNLPATAQGKLGHQH